MYICIYMHMYLYIYTYTCIHVYARVHEHIIKLIIHIHTTSISRVPRGHWAKWGALRQRSIRQHSRHYIPAHYGVATISRLLKIVCLFCRI